MTALHLMQLINYVAVVVLLQLRLVMALASGNHQPLVDNNQLSNGLKVFLLKKDFNCFYAFE